jgi:hypothetical protein
LWQFKRKKRQDTRSKRQSCSRLDFFAPVRRGQVSAPLRAKRRKKQETTGKSQEELFAIRFLCACLPQAGLCAFASKKKKEPRDKIQEE